MEAPNLSVVEQELVYILFLNKGVYWKLNFSTLEMIKVLMQKIYYCL